MYVIDLIQYMDTDRSYIEVTREKDLVSLLLVPIIARSPLGRASVQALLEPLQFGLISV